MFFTIYLPTGVARWEEIATKYKIRALRRIRNYKYTPSDYKLEQLLLEKYSLTLRQACFELILRCRFQSNLADSLTAVFQLDRDDKLARLITYGNGRVFGSNIIKNAFKD